MPEDRQILDSMTNISFRDVMILEGVLFKKGIITKEDFKSEHKRIFGEVKNERRKNKI